MSTVCKRAINITISTTYWKNVDSVDKHVEILVNTLIKAIKAAQTSYDGSPFREAFFVRIVPRERPANAMNCRRVS